MILLCQSSSVAAQDDYPSRLNTLVREHIEAAGVKNRRVLDAMRSTLRHEFVPRDQRRKAYIDTALPIGFGQTISSPYIVARMTEQIDPQRDDRVLEVGTGSGYQAAVLSPLVKDVYSIEIVRELAERATKTLTRLKYENVHVRLGDGYKGWPEHAPFDKIIVTCSPEQIPQPLVDQLADDGHLVIPVGERFQQTLYRFTKSRGKLKRERVESTFFVPMTGRAEDQRTKQPDILNPRVVNGSFEEVSENDDPLGWYYIRSGQVRLEKSSPHGMRCMEFTKRSSAPAYALQPIGIDGEKTKTLTLQFSSQGKGVQPELLSIQNSQLIVEFYDHNRKRCGEQDVMIGKGSFAWTKHRQTMEVPRDAKLAMIGIGLFGVHGTIWFDDISLSTIQR